MNNRMFNSYSSLAFVVNVIINLLFAKYMNYLLEFIFCDLYVNNLLTLICFYCMAKSCHSNKVDFPLVNSYQELVLCCGRVGRLQLHFVVSKTHLFCQLDFQIKVKTAVFKRSCFCGMVVIDPLKVFMRSVSLISKLKVFVSHI